MDRINANKKLDKMIILLFFSFLSLTAIPQNAEKKITIQNKNISLKEAFEQIELQTGYSIAYEQSDLDLSRKQSLSLKSASIDKAMKQVLKGTGYTYKIKGYHIIISLSEKKPNQREPMIVEEEEIKQYFPSHYNSEQMHNTILLLIRNWSKKRGYTQ